VEFKVQKQKSSQGENKVEHKVALTDRILSQSMGLGEVATLLWNGTTVRVQKVGDGHSYLIDGSVVRILPKQRPGKQGNFRIWKNGRSFPVSCRVVRPVEPKVTAQQLGGGPLKSPMSGKVLKVMVEVGSKVQEGALLCVVEAMKMENQIKSECHGTVTEVRAREGVPVTSGDVLFVLKPEET
jgi:biotin carboxyl carrier protein